MEFDTWWKIRPEAGEADLVASKLVPLVEQIEQASSMLYYKDQVHEAIYNNRMYAGSTYTESLSLLGKSGFSAAKLNVTRSIVQTIVSKLGVKRPAIKFSPDDADWSHKLRAKQLTRIIRGSNETAQTARVYPEVIKEACVTGTGIAHVDADDGRVVVERVPREELFVDPREARYGTPRSLFRRRAIAREKLAAKFPESRDAIMGCRESEGWAGDDRMLFDAVEKGNMIDVFEAWHLPSCDVDDDDDENENDGRHAIAIHGETLLVEEWKYPRFPFAFMRYDKPMKGFWGRGAVEDLADIQWKIDETVMDIQSALYFGAQLKIWLRQGSSVPKTTLGRTYGPSVYVHDGMKPEFESPNPVSRDQVDFLDRLIQLAHDLIGISQMQTAAKNPIGAGASAVALQEFYDIQSERYSQLEAMCSDWWLDVAILTVDAYKRLAEDDDEYSVSWAHRDVVHQVKWKDVDLAKDSYMMVLEPTNFLPDTRAGKLEAMERLAKAGIASGPELSAVMGGFPDLEKANRLRNASYDLCEKLMEGLSDPGVDMSTLTPDPHMDLDSTLKMAQAEYNTMRVMNAPEEVIERFLNFLSLLTGLINAAKAAAAPPPPPPGMMPGMPPGPPPGPEMGAAPMAPIPAPMPGQPMMPPPVA